MQYSDFIKMTGCGVYSITFPTEKLVETLENAELAELEEVKFEIVENPITGKKVHELDDNGLYWSVRAEFKQITKELMAQKSYEIKLRGKEREEDIPHLAKIELYQLLLAASEIYNFFYNKETQILMINSNSKRSKTAIMQIIELFGLAGVKSIIVSDEKLGINKRFVDWIVHRKPMFKFIQFANEATLRKDTHNERSYRSCRHIDSEKGKENALSILNEGFVVQSLAMEESADLNFKLDEHLRLRSLRFKNFAKTARELQNSPHWRKQMVFNSYITDQYHSLTRILRGTILEFTHETKLEQFA
ncbi:recombination-associated protein RdgC [Pasteurella caecimuris]|uniref:recombination-associated protein RdgC n=1 Tax=Rodentibacter caecimuris TaxID=1796644 RepID=UPI00214F64EF|nr:recombination-associated protein RdgC [Pasteurella caecimuris]MCR1838637.1 recombination-associated protein RdgC [Pasteurella caecimuris]MCU0108061.1 recombination-associated protein RdgC [Pasteurella caecimuris]